MIIIPTFLRATAYRDMSSSPVSMGSQEDIVHYLASVLYVGTIEILKAGTLIASDINILDFVFLK